MPVVHFITDKPSDLHLWPELRGSMHGERLPYVLLCCG